MEAANAVLCLYIFCPYLTTITTLPDKQKQIKIKGKYQAQI